MCSIICKLKSKLLEEKKRHKTRLGVMAQVPNVYSQELGSKGFEKCHNLRENWKSHKSSKREEV